MVLKSFFIILPSNSPGPGNRTNRFRIRLPKTLQFNGVWEVGLYSIVFPHSWPSIGTHEEQYMDIYLHTKQRVRISVPAGSYLVPEDLERSLNSSTEKVALGFEEPPPREAPKYAIKYAVVTTANQQEHIGIEPGEYIVKTWTDQKGSPVSDYFKVVQNPSETREQAFARVRMEANKKVLEGAQPLRTELSKVREFIASVKLTYDSTVNRFKFECDENGVSYIGLSTQLCYVLGFNEAQKLRNNDVATFPCDMRGGVSHIAVYTDISQPMVVGHRMASLLRIVTVSGKPGDFIQEVYQNPIFNRVPSREVPEIEVELKTLDNRPIIFAYGNCIVTLLFRKLE